MVPAAPVGKGATFAEKSEEDMPMSSEILAKSALDVRPAASVPSAERRRESSLLPVVSAVDAAPQPSLRPVSLKIAAGWLRIFEGTLSLAAGGGAVIAIAPQLPGSASLHAVVSLLGGLIAINLLHLLHAYETRVLRRLNAALWRISLAWSGAAVTATAILIGAGELWFEASRSWLVLWSITGMVSLVLGRVVFSVCVEHWYRSGRLQRRVAIVGTGPIGQRLLRRLNAAAEADVVVVGVYDDRLSRSSERCMGHKLRGAIDDLLRHVRQEQVDLVVVALPLSAERRMAEVMARLRQVAVDIAFCPDQYGFQLHRSEVEYVAGVPLIDVEERPLRDWRGVAKDVEDRLFAALILLMIAPVLLAIAILIKIDSPGPVFFRQKRYGLNNRLIEVLKFRTMYHHASDANAEQLTRRNDPRVTRLGAFLRRTSLDELPQFINVLRGDMSVVGPRPHALAAKAGGLLYQDAVRYYDARHRMKPGITGWAQVNGWRGETETVEQIVKRVEHDLHYIENWSVGLDLVIILRTVLGGFTGRQAY